MRSRSAPASSRTVTLYVSVPLFLETSRPGIFAVGDVRSGSVKRVAAIGPGSVAVRLAFERLQTAGTADPVGQAAR